VFNTEYNSEKNAASEPKEKKELKKKKEKAKNLMNVIWQTYKKKRLTFFF